MPDNIKEIYRNDITVSDVASTGEITLLTTDTNTQYVIKDVQVGSPLPGSTSPALQNNNFLAASLLANSSGTEIVDVSSTISARLYPSTPILTTNDLIVLDDATTLVTQKYSDINGATSTASTDVATVSTPILPVLTGSSTASEIAVASDGSFFWTKQDGNSTCTGYKRQGSPNGTQATIFNRTYGWAVFNGIDTYYSASYSPGSTLYKYNINTGATTSVNAGTAIAASSYPSAYFMNNGMILINRGTSYASNVMILNPVTNVYTLVNLNTVSPGGTTYKWSAYYDSVTDRYTIYRRLNTTLYKAVLSDALTLGTTYSGPVTYSTHAVLSLDFNSYVDQDSTFYKMGLHNVQGKTQLRVYDTVEGGSTIEDFIPYETKSAAIILSKSTAAASDFSQTSPLRLSGVISN